VMIKPSGLVLASMNLLRPSVDKRRCQLDVMPKSSVVVLGRTTILAVMRHKSKTRLVQARTHYNEVFEKSTGHSRARCRAQRVTARAGFRAPMIMLPPQRLQVPV